MKLIDYMADILNAILYPAMSIINIIGAISGFQKSHYFSFAICAIWAIIWTFLMVKKFVDLLRD